VQISWSNKWPVRQNSNLIKAIIQHLYTINTSLLLQVRFSFEIPTPGPAPAKLQTLVGVHSGTLAPWSLPMHTRDQRWPKSLFQTPTPVLFQIFWSRIQVRKIFKFENPTPVQTLATRDDHNPVYWLDIRKDNEFASGYDYPKTTFIGETDPDIRTLLVIFRGFRLLEKVAHCAIIHLF